LKLCGCTADILAGAPSEWIVSEACRSGGGAALHDQTIAAVVGQIVIGVRRERRPCLCDRNAVARNSDGSRSVGVWPDRDSDSCGQSGVISVDQGDGFDVAGAAGREDCNATILSVSAVACDV
jgi:hypothetical protein